ncbi:MAG: inositol monophosphatase, partial [Muribaculaceae bacterium]|nr:inositol monophosphatase [Muribaculaceae bacterium]
CVSIGIEYRGRKVAGVVYAPNLNELFYAVRGEGAFLNGRPIKVGGKSSLSESVVATGFPVDKDVNPVNNIDNVAVIVPQVRGLRRFGSAALDLCYVASGQFDGYWEMNLHEWDVCAALLILEEAGGVYSHFRSDRNISIVAGNKNIHDAIARRLKL